MSVGINVAEWVKVDTTKEAFIPEQSNWQNKFLTFKSRRCTYLSIFLHFLSQDTLSSVWEANCWLYEDGKKRVFGGLFDVCNIYKFLAIKIRVQGIHKVPGRNKLNGKALEIAMKDASDFFYQQFNQFPRPPGRNILTILNSRFLIDANFFERVSEAFQSIVQQLGEFVSGDEKLDYFTGRTGDLRYVPSKPAVVGLWHYQLVGNVSNKDVYLLDMHMARPHTQVGESDIMALIVGRWCKIIKKINKYLGGLKTTLCIDSYYMDSTSRTVLLQQQQSYSASVKSGRFNPIFNMIKEDVTTPGDFSSIYNETTNEIFTYYYDRNHHLGRRMVMSNVLKHVKGRKHPKGDIPGYTAHGVMFNGCDRFNNSLCDRMWPHKKGGHSVLGDRGKQDDFAFTSILLNTWTATKSILNLYDSNDDFLSFCEKLSYDLYEYACTLQPIYNY